MLSLTCRCGREREDVRYTSCDACRVAARDRMRHLSRRRRDCGQCTRCKAPAEVGELCRRCWFGMAAKTSLGNRHLGPALARLWLAQGGRCAYTGRRLVPGVNASLDHVLPSSRGGGDTLDNLVWCCVQVNRAKTDMTPVEFRALCAEVLAHHASRSACANDVSEENRTPLPADGPIFIGGCG